MIKIKRKVLEVYSFPTTYQGCIYEVKEVDTENLEKEELHRNVHISYELELISLEHPKQKIKNFSCLAVLFLFGYQPLIKEQIFFVPFNDLKELITKE